MAAPAAGTAADRAVHRGTDAAGPPVPGVHRGLALGVDAGPGRESIAGGGWAHSTVRSYEGALSAFLDYACDPRYGWAAECEQRVGVRLVQVCHEGNTAVHAAEYEGRPERRPLTRAELQAFLDAADDHVERAASSRRKGWLAAFRDATLFKVVYGWGLRRREAVMLDVTDFAPNPAAPELGGLGTCHARYGKAMQGSPPGGGRSPP